MFSTNAATRRAVVKFEFNSTEDNQLTISKGEEIDLIGEVTQEGWILARKANGEEGYIPDKYFEITASSRPKRPPPLPSATASPATTGAAGGSSSSGSKPPAWQKAKSSSTGSLLKQGDEYGLFAYQYEWYALVTLFTGSVLAFLYSTTMPDDQRVLFILICIGALLVSVVNFAILTVMRERCQCCGCGTIGIRIGLFILNGVLLVATPVGVVTVLIGFIAAVVEWQLVRLEIHELPSQLVDEWASQICGNGGLSNCSLGKLITFFALLAINIASLGYGFSDGYNYAIDETENVSTDYYLNPEITGLMFGFGRVITISMVLMLLFALYGCCARQERNIKANNKQNSGCGKFIHTVYSDVENRRFFHRVLGHCIVVSMFFHVIFAYYCYEDSSSTHSFYDIYGWWILVTGGICLSLMSCIVGSSNDTVCDQSPRLFNWSHRVTSGLLVLILIVHGSQTDIVGQWYWIFIVAPFSIYLCDALYRYARQDE